MNTKTCNCIKCGFGFEMPLNFTGKIICEACDPQMNTPKELSWDEVRKEFRNLSDCYMHQIDLFIDYCKSQGYKITKI